MNIKTKVSGLMLLLAAAVVQDANAEEYKNQFDDTCYYLERYHAMNYCTDLAIPDIVELADLSLGGMPAYGLYFQGTIYLNGSLPHSTFREAIVMHEMVHYILDKAEYADGTSVSGQCESERLAFAVALRFLDDHEYKTTVFDNWIEMYPQCKPLDTRPKMCYHLYNVGKHEQWALCMGVGYVD